MPRTVPATLLPPPTVQCRNVISRYHLEFLCVNCLDTFFKPAVPVVSVPFTILLTFPRQYLYHLPASYPSSVQLRHLRLSRCGRRRDHLSLQRSPRCRRAGVDRHTPPVSCCFLCGAVGQSVGVRGVVRCGRQRIGIPAPPTPRPPPAASTSPATSPAKVKHADAVFPVDNGALSQLVARAEKPTSSQQACGGSGSHPLPSSSPSHPYTPLGGIPPPLLCFEIDLPLARPCAWR